TRPARASSEHRAERDEAREHRAAMPTVATVAVGAATVAVAVAVGAARERGGRDRAPATSGIGGGRRVARAARGIAGVAALTILRRLAQLETGTVRAAAIGSARRGHADLVDRRALVGRAGRRARGAGAGGALELLRALPVG